MSKTVPQKLRRNERERNRVNQVNQGFNKLRNHVPKLTGPSKKLSKVDTLREAVKYIQYLSTVLQENGGVFPLTTPMYMDNRQQMSASSSHPHYFSQHPSPYYPPSHHYKEDISPGSSTSYYSDNSFEEQKVFGYTNNNTNQ